VRFGRAHGWHVVSDMAFSGAFPRGWRGDGIVTLPAFDAQLVRYVQEAGVPAVAIALTDDYLPFPCVSPDPNALGRAAADHLLERTYRNFGFAPFLNDRIHAARLAAFEARVREHGCRCVVLPAAHRRIGDYWHDDWCEYRRSLEAGLRELPKPAGILCGNDAIAAEIADVCHQLGIAVPAEVAILGVGNETTICESAATPLSSVLQDVEELAFQAAGLLREQMDGMRTLTGVHRVSSRSIVTRLSTDSCAVADPRVAQALNYIAENYPDPRLSVADISLAAGLSRRQLERSFRQQTGLSLSEHIVRRRMQEASRLLRAHARARIPEVAEHVGYTDTRTFFRAFRRHFGESPNVHRRVPPDHLAVIAALPGGLASDPLVERRCLAEVPASPL
jgi:LacI family transcriptional regulator